MVYFRRPFTQSGTRNPVPFDSQPDGSVSFQQGYTERYEQDPTTVGTARRIERDLMNGLFYEITLEIQRYQQSTWPVFIETVDNEGVPFAYAKNVIVERTVAADRRVYISRVDANVTPPTPGISGDWVEFDTVFTSGGGGEGGINWFVNGNFETGDSGWTILDGTLSLETGNPLQGAQSLNATVNVASATFFFRGTINQPDLVYRTRLHALEGVIVAPDTIGANQYKVALVDAADNTKVIGNTERVLKPGQNDLSGITFVPGDVVPALRVDVVDAQTATIGHVFTCDIFKATPDGEGYVEGEFSYDDSEVALAGPTGLIVRRGVFIPYRTADSSVRLRFNISVSIDSTTTPNNLTIAGITFKNATNFDQAVALAQGSSGGYADAVTNTNGIRVRFDLAQTRIEVSGDVELESWPTWATKGGGVKLLDAGVIYSSVKFSAIAASAASIGNNSPYVFSSTVVGDNLPNFWDGTVFIAPSKGTYKFSGKITADSGSVGTIGYRIDGGSAIRIATGPQTAPFEITLDLNQGQTFELINQSGSTVDYISFLEMTSITIQRLQDSSANAATGANTSLAANENEQYLITREQKATVILTNSGSSNINGTLKLERIGNVVFFTSVGNLTHDSSAFLTTDAGVIPEDFRPSQPDVIYNCYHYNNAAGWNIGFSDDGSFTLSYQNETGGAPNLNSERPINGSFVI